MIAGPGPSGAPTALLELRDLEVTFATEDGAVRAVDGVSFALERGRTLAVVGESGSGKTVTSQAIMRLHPRRSAIVSGQVFVDGTEVISAADDTVRSMRGRTMAMIFQDPLTALHPYYCVGDQLVEAVRAHQDVGRARARAQAVEMLQRVGVARAAGRLADYPHQLSGGLRQRVMIAMALVNSPALLIADEPTTALDVTVQAQIIDLLRDLQSEFGMAILLVTHDLGVVAELADDVVVMYGGRVVERGTATEVFAAPRMPYTWGLMSSVPNRTDERGGHRHRLRPIAGQPPSPLRLPAGCVFRPRCAYVEHVEGGWCDTRRPELVPVGPGHDVRCFLSAGQSLALAPTFAGGSDAASDGER